MYRYIVRESCSQFDSLPLTSLTCGSIHLSSRSTAAEAARSSLPNSPRSTSVRARVSALGSPAPRGAACVASSNQRLTHSSLPPLPHLCSSRLWFRFASTIPVRSLVSLPRTAPTSLYIRAGRRGEGRLFPRTIAHAVAVSQRDASRRRPVAAAHAAGELVAGAHRARSLQSMVALRYAARSGYASPRREPATRRVFHGARLASALPRTSPKDVHRGAAHRGARCRAVQRGARKVAIWRRRRARTPKCDAFDIFSAIKARPKCDVKLFTELVLHSSEGSARRREERGDERGGRREGRRARTLLACV